MIRLILIFTRLSVGKQQEKQEKYKHNDQKYAYSSIGAFGKPA